MLTVGSVQLRSPTVRGSEMGENVQAEVSDRDDHVQAERGCGLVAS